MRLHRFAFAGIAAVVACGGAGANGGAGNAAGASGSCLPVVPLTLLVLEHGREWEPIARLDADGKIWRKQSPIGSIASDHYFDREGKPVLVCEADRTIQVPGGPRATAHFDDRDRLVDGEGTVMWVGDDGVVHWEHGGRDVLGNARFEGDFRAARRTAILVSFSLLASANWSF